MKRRKPTNRLKSRPQIGETTRRERKENTFRIAARERAESNRASMLKRDEQRLIEQLEEKSKTSAFSFAKNGDCVFDSASNFSGSCISGKEPGIIPRFRMQRREKSVAQCFECCSLAFREHGSDARRN